MYVYILGRRKSPGLRLRVQKYVHVHVHFVYTIIFCTFVLSRETQKSASCCLSEARDWAVWEGSSERNVKTELSTRAGSPSSHSLGVGGEREGGGRGEGGEGGDRGRRRGERGGREGREGGERGRGEREEREGRGRGEKGGEWGRGERERGELHVDHEVRLHIEVPVQYVLYASVCPSMQD